jgi:hypothetical protein
MYGSIAKIERGWLLSHKTIEHSHEVKRQIRSNSPHAGGCASDDREERAATGIRLTGRDNAPLMINNK